MTPRPTPLPVRVAGIPDVLKAERRWVVWKYEWRDTAWTKTPYIATSSQSKADSTDPATWCSFADALAAYEDGKCDGIGFVLGDGWVGFDQDDDDNLQYPRMLQSYTERSPSGIGLHTIAKGLKPGAKCRTGPYELYDRGRYFTITGHVISDLPNDVAERTAEIAAVYASLFPNGADAPASPTSPTSLPDRELLAKARAARNGAKFMRLWNGDTTLWQGDTRIYESQSEADFALCELLAWWTNRDAAQMDRLFRRSGLMRPAKWDRVGAATIAKAIANTPTGYTGSQTPALRIRKASEVPDELLQLAFGGRLVRGNFGPLVGPGDVGKGMLAADTIARCTTGTPFPGEVLVRLPMAVLMCVTEDSEARVKSRLRTAGADLDLVHFVSGPEVTVGGLTMPSPMMLGDDAAGLLAAAKDLQADVLYLETIVEHFGDRAGKTRINTGIEAEVRRALAPIREICKQGHLFGFGALHPRKSHDGSIADSISGSAALNNVGRGVMHIYRDPDDETDAVRLLCSSKANYLRRLPRTLRFLILPWDSTTNRACTCTADVCPHEGRVIWGEGDGLYDDRSAEAVWEAIRDKGKHRRDTNVQEAEEFLTRVLARGSLALDKILELAKGEGISQASLKRAKKNLGVDSVMTDTFPATVAGWKFQ